MLSFGVVGRCCTSPDLVWLIEAGRDPDRDEFEVVTRVSAMDGKAAELIFN